MQMSFSDERMWGNYSSSFSPEENNIPAWARYLENVESASDASWLAPCLTVIITGS